MSTILQVDIPGHDGMSAEEKERALRAMKALERVFGSFSANPGEHYTFACNYLLSSIVNMERREGGTMDVDAWYKDWRTVLEQTRALAGSPAGHA